MASTSFIWHGYVRGKIGQVGSPALEFGPGIDCLDPQLVPPDQQAVGLCVMTCVSIVCAHIMCANAQCSACRGGP
jgi:hypothetical protein